MEITVKQVLEISLYAGQMLLGNGAEAYRVEETIERICRAYNFECECMATPKGVFVSVSDGNDEKVTSLKKVKTKRVDLYRIELVNSFSRSVQEHKLSYAEAKQVLKDIDGAPYFSFPVRLLAASMTSFIYALFFNGTIYDSTVAAVVSIAIYYMLEKTAHLGFFQFVEFFLSGFIIGFLSLGIETLFPFFNKGNIITGAIMILLPGVALTNGLKDIIYGDFMSGIVRFGESMLIIIAIGVGIASALTLGMGVKI